ncbi:hypothetical protein [Aeromicrobium yanjiei]|nr:hypothetical protein [Aeromicrobium yanjiei]
MTSTSRLTTEEILASDRRQPDPALFGGGVAPATDTPRSSWGASR